MAASTRARFRWTQPSVPTRWEMTQWERRPACGRVVRTTGPAGAPWTGETRSGMWKGSEATEHLCHPGAPRLPAKHLPGHPAPWPLSGRGRGRLHLGMENGHKMIPAGRKARGVFYSEQGNAYSGTGGGATEGTAAKPSWKLSPCPRTTSITETPRAGFKGASRT